MILILKNILVKNSSKKLLLNQYQKHKIEGNIDANRKQLDIRNQNRKTRYKLERF